MSISSKGIQSKLMHASDVSMRGPRGDKTARPFPFLGLDFSRSEQIIRMNDSAGGR